MIGGRGDALRDTRADDLCHCRLLVKCLHPVKSSPAMLTAPPKKNLYTSTSSISIPTVLLLLVSTYLVPLQKHPEKPAEV